MKKKIIHLASAALLLALTACGGGGGGGVAAGGGGGVTTGAGLFLDAPVGGMTYSSGATTGTTGADGSFTYEIGKTVTFKLGGITIGTATPTSAGTVIITPVDLVAGAANTTNATVQQIAVLLQTLDSDQNPANGIQISAATVQAAAGQSVNFTNPASVAAVLNAVAPGVTIVTAAQATANMNSARKAATAGHYTGTIAGTCSGIAGTGTWNLDITSAGSISGGGSVTTTQGTFTSTGTGSVNAMGAVSYTAVGMVAGTNAAWTGTATLGGGFSGTWSAAGVPGGCSGTFTGTKSVHNVATFAGIYQGSYSGTDTGSWNVTVSSAGKITGTGTSTQVGAFTVGGTVASNGSATMTQSQGGTSTGATFTGTVNAYGSISGTWSNGAAASGSFSGFRN